MNDRYLLICADMSSRHVQPFINISAETALEFIRKPAWEKFFIYRIAEDDCLERMTSPELIDICEKNKGNLNVKKDDDASGASFKERVFYKLSSIHRRLDYLEEMRTKDSIEKLRDTKGDENLCQEKRDWLDLKNIREEYGTELYIIKNRLTYLEEMLTRTLNVLKI